MNIDAFDGDQWRSLAGVGAGYLLACALIFLGFFVLPWLVVASL